MSNFKRDWEDFKFLTPYLESNMVRYIENSHPFFEKIMKSFPIQSIRIEWEKVPHKEVYISKRYPENKEDIDRHVSKIFAEEKISAETNIFVCFDGYTEGALSMPLQIFILFANEILTSPQHTYVIPDDFSWCLNYTMTHHLYFGYTPQ